MLDDKTYTILKWVVMIAVPAVMTAIGTIGEAVGFDQTGLYLTIIGALNTCLGTMMGVSNKKYKKQGPTE
ncbi:phage holin [Tetragenococcus halophilus]|uniref:phage holin n=1 Tax=Tetragenococcus halophilus TaxID=51669 RepID=UPI000B92ADD2|nr:phage holin [Tetragenococcus halophilus]MDN6572058.1 phage holin [Staphylococcus equorum]MDN6730362.1 phage holin [Alkalibacterium sp.]MCO8284478.1 holin [Tetragenococcus halophilus]MDN6750236.1 phage holin [Staphylococcus equorum]GBD66040.1 hypothetical protein TEHN7116_1004 [Tetragenococcus halophilus subsp. halophilus]